MFGTESGLKHAVLLDRKMGGGFVSEARSRHPTCKESNDAASETRHPTKQERKMTAYLLSEEWPQ